MTFSTSRRRRDLAGFGICAGVILWITATTQAQVIQDFDDPPFTTTQHGSEPMPAVVPGGPDGHYLQLTHLTGSQSNTIAFDEDPSVSGPQPFGTTLSFDFRMTDDQANADAGGCCGQAADGFGLGLFLTSTYGTTGPGPGNGDVVWERPAFPDAFTVGFDIFDSGGGPEVDGNTITINALGTEIVSNTLPADTPLNNNLFNHAEVAITPDGTSARVSMSLTWDVYGPASSTIDIFDDVLIEGLDLTTLPGFRVIAGSRTGGAFHGGDLDNIRVQSIPIPEPSGALLALVGIVALNATARRRV